MKGKKLDILILCKRGFKMNGFRKLFFRLEKRRKK